VADDADYAYRAFRANCTTAYAPEPLVYHAHERVTEADLRKSRKDYVLGRGAFYAKHIAQRDRHALRMAYWEIYGLWRSGLKPAARDSGEMRNRTVLRYLLAGAIDYGWFNASSAFSRHARAQPDLPLSSPSEPLR
jgi:GT2 family glycosyltransferase